MTYTMLPLRLRESLIGGMLLSGTHLYTCLHTQYSLQVSEEEEEESLQQPPQATLLWQEVNRVCCCCCNCLWLPQIMWCTTSINRFCRRQSRKIHYYACVACHTHCVCVGVASLSNKNTKHFKVNCWNFRISECVSLMLPLWKWLSMGMWHVRDNKYCYSTHGTTSHTHVHSHTHTLTHRERASEKHK